MFGIRNSRCKKCFHNIWNSNKNYKYKVCINKQVQENIATVQDN